MAKKNKWYALLHPGGPGGVVSPKPKRRKQDHRAKPMTAYVVAFFPKITTLGPAALHGYSTKSTLASSPEAAKAKFMDGIMAGEKWETYADAGHRIRKVRITDLGDAERPAVARATRGVKPAVHHARMTTPESVCERG